MLCSAGDVLFCGRRAAARACVCAAAPEYDVVGTGASGVVYRGEYRGKPVAVKRQRVAMAVDAHANAADKYRFGLQPRNRDRTYADLMNEIRISVFLPRHPNICRFYGACIDERDMLIGVYEYVEGTDIVEQYDVWRRLDVHRWKPPIDYALTLCSQLADGLACLHGYACARARARNVHACALHMDAGAHRRVRRERDRAAKRTGESVEQTDTRAHAGKRRCRPAVIHRDIKPANLLIHSTNKNLKICDFGLCTTREFDEHGHMLAPGVRWGRGGGGRSGLPLTCVLMFVLAPWRPDMCPSLCSYVCSYICPYMRPDTHSRADDGGDGVTAIHVFLSVFLYTSVFSPVFLYASWHTQRSG